MIAKAGYDVTILARGKRLDELESNGLILVNSTSNERILIGFPSGGGERKAGIVNYFIGKGPIKLFQSTTFGELNGKTTERLLELVKIFEISGFSPEMNNNMDAWQKTHVAVVVPIGKALYRFDSDNYRLARSYSTLRKMVLAKHTIVAKVEMEILEKQFRSLIQESGIKTPNLDSL